MKQVKKTHYDFDNYCYPERWASYYHQLRETVALAPHGVLEVGVGDGVFRDYIKNNTAIAYTSLDIADDVAPDILGNIEDMPVRDDAYDAVCAFEILEHLPYERFDRCLAEIARVSRQYAVVSLPHFGPTITFSCKVPFLPEVRLAVKLPFPRKHTFNGQHYWEIGKYGYPLSRILAAFQKHFKVQKHFVLYNTPYHHFFVLEKRTRYPA